MQHSYLLSVISFGNLCSLIIRNRGVSFKYLGRFLFLLQGSLWSSLFNIIEKLKGKDKSLKNNFSNGPVFIVGHWRTGSTFLHQLLSIDKQFVTPSVVQVSVPESFPVSQKYFRKIMSKVIDDKRPMDNVKLGPDEPQEDEYAIVKMIKNTPLEKLFFRRKKTDFIDDLRNAVQIEKISKSWKDTFSKFVARLTYSNKNAIPLLKNPFHSFRIKEILEIYPNAKFIHIYRDPVNVIPSTIRMWNIVGKQNLLAGKWKDVSSESAATMFNFLWQELKEGTKLCNENNFTEISFEKLENDPVTTVKDIYNKLNLDFSVGFDNELNEYLLSLRSYKKNEYTLDEDLVMYLKTACADFIQTYNY